MGPCTSSGCRCPRLRCAGCAFTARRATRCVRVGVFGGGCAGRGGCSGASTLSAPAQGVGVRVLGCVVCVSSEMVSSNLQGLAGFGFEAAGGCGQEHKQTGRQADKLTGRETSPSHSTVCRGLQEQQQQQPAAAASGNRPSSQAGGRIQAVPLSACCARQLVFTPRH